MEDRKGLETGAEPQGNRRGTAGEPQWNRNGTAGGTTAEVERLRGAETAGCVPPLPP